MSVYTNGCMCVCIRADLCVYVCTRVPSRARYTHAMFVRFNNRLPGVVIWSNYAAWNKRKPFVVDIEFCFSNFCRLAIFVWEKKILINLSSTVTNQGYLFCNLKTRQPSTGNLLPRYFTPENCMNLPGENFTHNSAFYGDFCLIFVIHFTIVVVFDEFYLQRWACVRIN